MLEMNIHIQVHKICMHAIPVTGGIISIPRELNTLYKNIYLTAIYRATQKFGEFKQGAQTGCRMPFCH